MLAIPLTRFIEKATDLEEIAGTSQNAAANGLKNSPPG
jgi:hypothetical protein